MAIALFEMRRFARGGSRGQGPWPWPAPQELNEEVQGRAALLPVRPPHRQQYRLRLGANPGAAATPDPAQDHPDADRQFCYFSVIPTVFWRKRQAGKGLAIIGLIRIGTLGSRSFPADPWRTTPWKNPGSPLGHYPVPPTEASLR
jgi:hypothetical protein